MQQRFGGIQRNKEKEGMGNGKKCFRKIKRLRFKNEFTDNFLERDSDADKDNVT